MAWHGMAWHVKVTMGVLALRSTSAVLALPSAAVELLYKQAGRQELLD
jgi:hypothetical protein